jgi:hypothetical protein
MVVGQASSLAVWEPPSEDCAIEVNATGNSVAVRYAPFFNRLSNWLKANLVDKELSQSSAFGSGSRDLHRGFRRRQAELCEDG